MTSVVVFDYGFGNVRSMVRALANHLLVMKNGRVVEEGPARRVFANPEHPYTQALLAAALNLEATGNGVVAV